LLFKIFQPEAETPSPGPVNPEIQIARRNLFSLLATRFRCHTGPTKRPAENPKKHQRSPGHILCANNIKLQQKKFHPGCGRAVLAKKTTKFIPFVQDNFKYTFRTSAAGEQNESGREKFNLTGGMKALDFHPWTCRI